MTLTINKKAALSPINYTDVTVGKPYEIRATSNDVPNLTEYMIIDDAGDAHWIAYTASVTLNSK